jgi:hypothetical protein
MSRHNIPLHRVKDKRPNGGLKIEIVPDNSGEYCYFDENLYLCKCIKCAITLLRCKIDGKSADLQVFASRVGFHGSALFQPDSVQQIHPETSMRKSNNII